MIYVTHDQTEALTFADTVVVMHDGAVVQIGTPEELFERPAHTFVGYFIGSPGMNIVPAAVDGREARIDGHVIGLHRNYGVLPKDAKIEIGIRPEFVDVARARIGPVVRHASSASTISAASASPASALATPNSPRACRRDFPVPDETAGLVFDPAHVHVYADSLLVEGKA